MRLPTTEDPAGAFDYANLTPIHNTAYDTPVGWLLVGGWFLTLAAAVITFCLERLYPNRRRTDWPRRLVFLTALLVVGPIAASLGVGWYSNNQSDGDKVANVWGYLQGSRTSDRDGEFKAWAKARYGMELTAPQITEVLQPKSTGFMTTSNETHPIIFNGALVHGMLAAGQIVIADDNGHEIPRPGH